MVDCSIGFGQRLPEGPWLKCVDKSHPPRINKSSNPRLWIYAIIYSYMVLSIRVIRVLTFTIRNYESLLITIWHLLSIVKSSHLPYLQWITKMDDYRYMAAFTFHTIIIISPSQWNIFWNMIYLDH